MSNLCGGEAWPRPLLPDRRRIDLRRAWRLVNLALLQLPAAGHFADIAAHAAPIRHIVTGCLAHALVALQLRAGEARS